LPNRLMATKRRAIREMLEKLLMPPKTARDTASVRSSVSLTGDVCFGVVGTVKYTPLLN
jgi:hypothetical protein